MILPCRSNSISNLKGKIQGKIVKCLPEKLSFVLKKYHYVRELRNFWERDCEIVRLLVAQGEWVIDVGANVGWYTKILSELVGQDGVVFSIEPITPTFRLLSYCIAQLGLRNVQVLNYAISDQESEVSMEIPHYASGGDNFYQARIVKQAPWDASLKKYLVRSRTLDSVFLQLPKKIAFIKCDVEGHELYVFKGARQLISRSRPALLIEISRDPDDPRSESHLLFSYLQENGYVPYWFDGKKLKRRAVGEASVNYFFLQMCHVEHLKEKGVRAVD